MSNLRFEAVSEASKRKPVEVTAPSERPSEFFGKKVFNRQKMYKYLPADVYEKLVDVIDNGARLDRNIANAVAKGIKQWADENGVTHYTHWFQPLTEGTAEKHDAFIEHESGERAVTLFLPLLRQAEASFELWKPAFVRAFLQSCAKALFSVITRNRGVIFYPLPACGILRGQLLQKAYPSARILRDRYRNSRPPPLRHRIFCISRLLYRRQNIS